MTYTYYICLHVDRKKTRFKRRAWCNGNKGWTYMYIVQVRVMTKNRSNKDRIDR